MDHEKKNIYEKAELQIKAKSKTGAVFQVIGKNVGQFFKSFFSKKSFIYTNIEDGKRFKAIKGLSY